jgi:hypothetical protein
MAIVSIGNKDDCLPDAEVAGTLRGSGMRDNALVTRRIAHDAPP